MKKRLLLLAFVSVLTSTLFAQIPYAYLDSLGMVRPTINHHPEACYMRAHQDFAMNNGIAKTAKGRIWNCWIGGEDDEEAYLLLAYSDNDGKTWTDTKFVIDPHNAAEKYQVRTLGGVPFVDQDNRLWLFFDQGVTYYDGRIGVWASVCENPDSKKPTFSTPKYIAPGIVVTSPIILTDGTWLLPVSLWFREGMNPISLNHGLVEPCKDAYHELDSLRKANVYISSDKGSNWTLQGGVLFPNENYNEHNIVELSDGRILMTARTTAGMQQSISSDKGKTWSKPQKLLPHITSRHLMLKLNNNNLLLVKHGKAHESTSGRTKLTAMISKDGGFTWQGHLELDGRDYVSYPYGFQDKDGYIYVSYDRARSSEAEILMAKFTEEDVLASALISKNSFLKHIIYKAGQAPSFTQFLYPHADKRPVTVYRVDEKTSIEQIEKELWSIKNIGYGAFLLEGNPNSDNMHFAQEVCKKTGNQYYLESEVQDNLSKRIFVSNFHNQWIDNRSVIDFATRIAYISGFLTEKQNSGKVFALFSDNQLQERTYNTGYGIVTFLTNPSTTQDSEVRLQLVNKKEKVSLWNPMDGKTVDIDVAPDGSILLLIPSGHTWMLTFGEHYKQARYDVAYSTDYANGCTKSLSLPERQKLVEVMNYLQ